MPRENDRFREKPFSISSPPRGRETLRLAVVLRRRFLPSDGRSGRGARGPAPRTRDSYPLRRTAGMDAH
jgi:hypothetical protein